MKQLLALVLLPALAVPAFAHAQLVKSSPANGATVNAPRHVVLTFSDALEPAFSGALVMDKDGRNFVGGRTLVDGPVMTLTPGRLAPGRYRVEWHAVSHDTHRTQGDFSFTVNK